MAEETQYTANTGIAKITTANTSLTGSGTLNTDIWNVLTAGANGTLIKTVTVKAIANTTHGMVRLFIYDGTANTRLLQEIDITPVTKASISPAFETKIELNFILKAGYILRATTQNTETFNVIAEGMNWAYYAPSVREDTTQFTANNGIGSDATANTNLDGTGTLVTVYTAGASATYKGSAIETITVKATVNNTPGMVRLYIYDGSTAYLFKEIIIPSITKTATDKACDITVVLEDNFDIKAGYLIKASTEKAENFNILVEGKDWNYAA
jgi:hypothetical protein